MKLTCTEEVNSSANQLHFPTIYSVVFICFTYTKQVWHHTSPFVLIISSSLAKFRPQREQTAPPNDIVLLNIKSRKRCVKVLLQVARTSVF